MVFRRPFGFPLSPALPLMLALSGCGDEPAPPPPIELPGPEALRAHSQEFTRDLIEVVEGVHVAIGYGVANVILLEGEGGNIIVDTGISLAEARRVRAEFERINSNPVVALIYTHNHGDHIFGAKAWVGPADGEVTRAAAVPVYAHETTTLYIDRLTGIVNPIVSSRSARMFGSRLNPRDVPNVGIGPYLGLSPGDELGFLRPTVTFRDRLDVTIAGVRLELYHSPGETNDQIMVYLPDKKTILPGDNLYRAFPNLYTIRGTPYRDLAGWVASLDRMRYLEPEYLVPSHSRPLAGADTLARVLTDYRDAIQYVHDQTLRGMNKGLTPDELVGFVRLPDHLAKSPFLQPFYGTVPWSVRSVFSGYLGWFDGNPTTLNPLAPTARARHMAELAGGVAALGAALTRALAAGEYQWALQLSDYLLRLAPDDEAARRGRIAALKALGEAESNPNARHYYLTVARELEGLVDYEDLIPPTSAFLEEVALDAVLARMKTNLVPEKARDLTSTLVLRFSDSAQVRSLIIRRGVLEIQPFDVGGADLEVVTTEQLFKEAMSGARNMLAALAANDLDVVKGSSPGFLRFLGNFRE